MPGKGFSKRIADQGGTILSVATIVALLIGAASFIYGVTSARLITDRLNLISNHMGEITTRLEGLQEGQSQITNDHLRLTTRLDASLQAADIRANLSSELTADTALEDWRSFAVSSGYVFIESADPKTYSLKDQGRALVNELKRDLFEALANSAPFYPTTAAQLKSVPLATLAVQLAEYNFEHNTFISLEAVLGILAAFLEPQPG